MSVEELYQDIIVDHSKHPRNFRIINQPSHQAEGLNPLCGDCVSVFLSVKDGKVVDASFQGSGCAISRASASLLTQQVIGMSVEDANRLVEEFRLQMLSSCPDPHRCAAKTGGEGSSLGDAGLLKNVKRFPTRVNCALLAWNTLRDALGSSE